MQITRRRALQAAATLAGSAYLSACARGNRFTDDQSVSDDSAVASISGATFVEPEQLRSVYGILEVSLTAAAANFPTAVAGALAYNNAPVGPTLRLRPGERLVVELTNELEVATNLHTHGLNVSPASPADDVFVRIAPGETRRYEYELPNDHPSGLFWYHPHRHGDVARQVGAGLVGAIIVDDEIDDRPEISTTRERLWVLNDPSDSERGATGMDQMHGRAGDQVRVNGVVQPTLEAAAGQTERWRIVNASASRMLPFSVEGLALTLIGTDGGRLSESVEVDGLVLAPGERAEVLVSPTAELPVRTVSPSSPLAIMTVDGSVASIPTPDMPGRIVDPSEFEIGPVTERRTLRLGSDMSGGGMMSGDSMLEFTIDGRTFDPDRVDISTSLGAIEEWTIVNETGMDHPFHLHVWPFQVIDENGWPGWKDTVNVPGGGEVTIRIPFVGHSGRSVYHCHILDHEDIGMMGVIDVAGGSKNRRGGRSSAPVTSP